MDEYMTTGPNGPNITKFYRDVLTPQLGDNVIKAAKSTLICCRCYIQVEICGFCNNGLPKYWCPECGKYRNPNGKHPTAKWIEYAQYFEYRKARVI